MSHGIIHNVTRSKWTATPPTAPPFKENSIKQASVVFYRQIGINSTIFPTFPVLTTSILGKTVRSVLSSWPTRSHPTVSQFRLVSLPLTFFSSFAYPELCFCRVFHSIRTLRPGFSVHSGAVFSAHVDVATINVEYKVFPSHAI